MPDVAPPSADNLPTRRRLMMQQLERHAELYAQEAASDHYIDDGHSLQQELANSHGYQNLANGSLLRAKYGLLAQSHTTRNIDNHLEEYTADDDPQPTAANDDDDDHHHLQQQESAVYRKRGSNNVSVLPAKYGLPDHSHAAYSDHHHHDGYHTIDDHQSQHKPAAQQYGSEPTSSMLETAESHGVYNSYHRGKHIEQYTDDDHSVQQDSEADLKPRKGSWVVPSALEAAQAQAAELRALHSAMLNNYGFAERSSGAAYNHHHKQKQKDDLLHKSRPRKASKKKSKLYIDKDQGEEVQNPPSSASSASSTADCFIRPAHEYPIFTPSHEGMLLVSKQQQQDDANSKDRRSSAEKCEALMREERLNYIFDHNNKKSFSGMQHSNRSMRDNNSISCLHESLNLPRRSASSLTQLHDIDDHRSQHMSLNLPAGSQLHQMFPQSSSDPLSVDRFSDKNFHNAQAPNNKPLKAQVDQYPHELRNAFTGRQRALLQFLSEEPSRMRAFKELAAMETLQSEQIDAAGGNQRNSRRNKGKYESNQSADHPQGSSSDHHLRHQSAYDPDALSATSRSVRQKSAHSPNADHHDQITSSGVVSCDKCKPLNAGSHTVSRTLSHSEDLGTSPRPPAKATNAAAPAPAKEKPDQKKPASIKGWFFRGKKKQNNADLSNGQANPASTAAASKDRTLITSGASSATIDQIQSNARTTSSVAATSHIYSGLINPEAERELEVAMAMDLMELKVLQAKTKRDAAMAEVLELRLAMDSMAKKLVEVERHCVALKAQLTDAQAIRQYQDDQKIADHQNSAPTAAGITNAADQLNVNSDDPDAVETSYADNYETDSIDQREERRPSKGISLIRAGVSSGYGGRNTSGRYVQPSKEQFLNAVADARVGIKQISRVLMQHVQESKGAGALLQIEAGCRSPVEEEAAAGMENDQGGLMKKGREGENWGPILVICREAARREKLAGMISRSGSAGGRGRGVAHNYVEALISVAFHEHFENVGFDKSGTHKILDPLQRALAFYHSFLKLSKLTPTQLLTQPSPLFDSAFDRFCSRKMRAVGRAVGCPGRLWPDELARTFLSAARAVWLLHHLAFAYPSRPPGIFRVAAQSSFDARFMEVLPIDHRHVSLSSNLLVSLMVMPGFFLPDEIIKCKVLAS